MIKSISPNEHIEIELSLPGDKSISHRAAIIGAISDGKTVIHNYATGADCKSTLDCLRKLGVSVFQNGDVVSIEGVGLHGLVEPSEELDAGNSGTTLRLLTGILAGQSFKSVIAGDRSLNKRPMLRIIEPLQRMGAEISSTDVNTPPLTIHGKKLRCIDYSLPVASAQVKSCVLLAGLYAEGTTRVFESSVSRDHTERMLDLKIDLLDHKGKRTRVISVEGGSQIFASEIKVPSDFSAASYLIAAGILVKRSRIVLRKVGLNPTRTGFLTVLEKMGANIKIENICRDEIEPFGDIIAETSNLKGVTLKGKIISNIIDEIPIFAILGTKTDSGLTVRNAEELRYKESDRISSIVNNLRKMNGRIEEYPDGFKVFPSSLSGASLDSFHDHRIAMAFGIAGLIGDSETTIGDAHYAGISYPGFWDLPLFTTAGFY